MKALIAFLTFAVLACVAFVAPLLGGSIGSAEDSCYWTASVSSRVTYNPAEAVIPPKGWNAWSTSVGKTYEVQAKDGAKFWNVALEGTYVRITNPGDNAGWIKQSTGILYCSFSE